MRKYIYKITNMINNKCYIGQTKDYKKRFQQHKTCHSDSEPNKVLYKAIKKYGVENFTFEVIDEGENYNELEKYWIQYYNSYKHGYNETLGGEEPPVHIGLDSPFCKHSKETVDIVKNLLLTTTMSTQDIGKLTNYDDTTVVRINKGILWYDETLTYPLRKELTNNFKLERALNIIFDLQNTKLTQKQIAEKYGVGRTTVTAINRGQNHKQDNIEYPIRK